MSGGVSAAGAELEPTSGRFKAIQRSRSGPRDIAGCAEAESEAASEYKVWIKSWQLNYDPN